MNAERRLRFFHAIADFLLWQKEALGRQPEIQKTLTAEAGSGKAAFARKGNGGAADPADPPARAYPGRSQRRKSLRSPLPCLADYFT